MPAATSSQTISDALHTATTMLSRATSSPRLDAELLLAYVTGLSRTDFRKAPDRELPVKAGWSFQQLVKRRMQGEPVAYIIGQQDFWSLTLEVDPAVLIPRPETELLIERALERLPADAPVSALDLGAGSGAIALALAHERRRARITAVDVSREALQVAVRNAARLQLDNVIFAQGSWYEPLGGQRFDVIVSNPPYIALGDPDLAPDVHRFEPRDALIAGPTGLEAIEEIVSRASQHLQPEGWLLIEHGWKQGADVRSRFLKHGFTAVNTHRDLEGRERVTEGRALRGGDNE